jgi:hypothetical protein
MVLHLVNKVVGRMKYRSLTDKIYYNTPVKYLNFVELWLLNWSKCKISQRAGHYMILEKYQMPKVIYLALLECNGLKNMVKEEFVMH